MRHKQIRTLIWMAVMLNGPAASGVEPAGILIARVIDSESRRPLPARVYLRNAAGDWLLPDSSDGQRIATHRCQDTIVGTGIEETYTLTGAQPFQTALPAGRYELTVERGKEYHPLTKAVEIEAGQSVEIELPLQRGFDMAGLGWYSADCHVHTPLDELPHAQLADDVNVAFPLTAWTTHSEAVPTNRSGGDVPGAGKPVRIDETHVYWNLNTEYEIFRVADQSCCLGAILILGHTKPFELTCPPVAPIIEAARKQGAVVDLEKPTWPWASMLLASDGVHTFELSFNAMWRQRTVHNHLWGRTPPGWIVQPTDAGGFIAYGFEMYYMGLNAGRRLRASAGCANGVHPVPLGHSRIYVKIDGPFSYDKWFGAFRKGRSFATNGPMLLLEVDGHAPGEVVTLKPGEAKRVHVGVEVLTLREIERVELVVNGKVTRVEPGSETSNCGMRFETALEIRGTTWVAARCFEISAPDNPRFAHTSPVHFDDQSTPLYPDRRQTQYLLHDVQAQINRLEGALPEAAVKEYKSALRAYRAMDR